jgi:hypothetical protein
VLLGVQGLTWENYLRNKEAWDTPQDKQVKSGARVKTPQITFPYQFVLCVYIGAALSFTFINVAWLYAKKHLESICFSVPLVLTGIGILITVALFIYLFIYSLKIYIQKRRQLKPAG